MKKIIYSIIMIMISFNLILRAQNSDPALIEDLKKEHGRNLLDSDLVKKPDSARGRFIVRFKDDASFEEAVGLVKKYELEWESHFPKMFSCRVKITGGALTDQLNELKKSSIVLRAENTGKNGGDSKNQYFLVHFNVKATEKSAEELIKSIKGLEIDSYLQDMKWGVIHVSGDKNINELMEKIKGEPIVKFVELDHIYGADPDSYPDDTLNTGKLRVGE